MSFQAQRATAAAPAVQSSFRPLGCLVQRKSCGADAGPKVESERCRETLFARQHHASDHGESGGVPPIVHDVLSSPGKPLDRAARKALEPRFGHDFSRVRVHTDARAAESARAVNARAYTVGEQIVFGPGSERWNTTAGQRLLAHEISHVVQQKRGGSSSPESRPTGDIERDADAAASAFLAGRGKVHIGTESAPRLARQPLFSGSREAADRKPRSLGGSLGSLDDTDLEDEIERISEWLELNPGDSFDRTHLLRELERMEAARSRRIERYRREDKYRADVARIVEAVNAGQIPRWMKVFPFRPSRGIFRMDVAPIMARKKGDKIIVQQPYTGVAATDRFKKDVRTLPGDVFTGGHALRPNELVGIRIYDENEKVIVIYAKDLLKFAEASDKAVLTNIALTAVSVVAGPAVGRLGGRALGSVLRTGQNWTQRGLVSATLGTAEAAPTALGGVASRTTVALVEGRAASTVAQQAIGQTTVRAGAQTAAAQSAVEVGAQAAPALSPSLGGIATTVGGTASTQVAGATLVQVSPAEYTARLSFVTPQQYDNAVLNAVEQAGQQAAVVLANAAIPAGARFIQACQNRNWTLAGTLFHAEAARQLQAIAPSVPGTTITAEDTVQAGRGGSRLDVTARDASGNHYNIDWKTTGRSAFSSKSRAELRRHSAQYQANRGAPLHLQISKSWVDFVRSLIPNINWPK